MVQPANPQVFLLPDHAGATQTQRHVKGQLHTRWPKLLAWINADEYDVIAYMTSLRQHRAKLHLTATPLIRQLVDELPPYGNLCITALSNHHLEARDLPKVNAKRVPHILHLVAFIKSTTSSYSAVPAASMTRWWLP